MTGKHSRTDTLEKSADIQDIIFLEQKLADIEMRYQQEASEVIRQIEAVKKGEVLGKHARASRLNVQLYEARKNLAVFLIPFVLLIAMSSSLANWAQNTIVNRETFLQITSEMANDADLKQQLQEAVTNDLLNNPAIHLFVGDGDGSGFWGELRNWGHEQIEDRVPEAVGAVFDSADYPELWRQVMNATYDYNMSEQGNAGINITPIFNAVINKINGFELPAPDFIENLKVIDFSIPDFPTIDKPMVLPLELPFFKVFTFNIHMLKAFSNSWAIQMLVALALAIISLLLAPKRRLWILAITNALLALLLWKSAGWANAYTLPTFGSETATVFSHWLTDPFTSRLVSEFHILLWVFMVVSILLFIAAISVTVIKLRAKELTPRTQWLVKALG